MLLPEMQLALHHLVLGKGQVLSVKNWEEQDSVG